MNHRAALLFRFIFLAQTDLRQLLMLAVALEMEAAAANQIICSTRQSMHIIGDSIPYHCVMLTVFSRGQQI